MIGRASERVLVPIAKTSKKLRLSLLAAGIAAAACGHPVEHDACPLPPEMGCPPEALTFDTGISELLHTRCFPCHSADGVEQSRQLTDYLHVSNERRSILTQLASCSMPPAGSPPLTSSERQQIFDWLACQGPE